MSLMPIRCAGGVEMTSLKYLKDGEYEIETYEDGRVPATFHAKAPFDPKGDRIKGIYPENVVSESVVA